MKQKIVGLSLTIVMAIIAFVMGIVTMFAPTAARAEEGSFTITSHADVETEGKSLNEVVKSINENASNPSIVISITGTVTISEPLVVENSMVVSGGTLVFDKSDEISGRASAFYLSSTAKSLTIATDIIANGEYGINFDSETNNASVIIAAADITAYLPIRTDGANNTVSISDSNIKAHNIYSGPYDDTAAIVALGQGNKVTVNSTSITASKDDGCTGMHVLHIGEKSNVISIANGVKIESHATVNADREYDYFRVDGMIVDAGNSGYNNFYYSFVEAVDAAVNGDTVNLLWDTVVSSDTEITIPEDKNITIDLTGNALTANTYQAIVEGKEVTKHYYALTNNGTLTLKDSSKNGTGSVSARGIYNGYNGSDVDVANLDAKLIVESGAFNAIDADGGACVFNCGTLVVNGGTFHGELAAINNRKGATATINDGTFSSGDYDADVGLTPYAIQNYDGTLTVEKATVTEGFGAVGTWGGTTVINDGTFAPSGTKGTTNHVVYTGSGSVTINGGEFTINNENSEGGSIITVRSEATANVTGGTFIIDAEEGEIIKTNAVSSEGSIKISGGTFDENGSLNIQGNANISGGTFKTNKVTISNSANVEISGGSFTETALESIASKTDIVAMVYNTATDTNSYYTDWSSMINGAQDGDTIVMLADTNAGATWVNKSLYIDLNGKTITSTETPFQIYANAQVTIDDSSAGKSGVIESTTYPVLVYQGKLVLKNGTLRSTNSYAVFLYGNGNTATVDGGVVEGKSGGNAVYVQGADTDGGDNRATFILNDGEIKGAITGNGNSHYTNIVINGGSVTADNAAIYQPQIGNLTITGGTITGGNTGIEVRSGNVNISGGTITGNGANVSVTPSGSGTTVVGAALAISQHSTENDINVTITGGTFNGAMAVYEVDIQNDDSDNIAIDIQNGTFNGAVDSENVTEFITGGTFTGAEEIDNALLQSGLAFENGAVVDAVAKIVSASGVVKAYSDIEVAFDALVANDTMYIFAGTHYLNDSDEWHPRNVRFDIPDSVSIYGVGDVVIEREPYFYATNLYVENVDFKGYGYVAMQIHGSAKFVDCRFEGPNGLYQSTVENGGTIEFVDCEIIGDVYALNITGTGNVVVTNCDISGWNSVSVSGTTTITGCKFVEGEDYNYLRFYNDTVIKDTDFAGAYEIDTAGTPDVEFKNVTVDGDKDKLADIISFYAKNSANVTIDGAKVEDYEINNVEELIAFADLVNGGNDFKGKTFILGNDINMDYDGVTIGTKANPFNGTFDGQNHTIQNLTINDDTADYVGLFGFTNGTIKNVTVNNPHIVGRSYVAAIVGCAYTGTVENCYVTGKIDIKGNYMVGGITGHGYANIKNCRVIGDANRDYNYIGATYLQKDLEGDNVGGIVGHKAENTTLSGCRVENVTIEGTRKIGGIVGTTFQNNKISDCSVKNITVRTNATEEYASQNSNSMALGGIIGLTAQNYTGGTVANCAVEGVKFEVENELTTFVSAGAISGGHRVSGIATPVAPESTTFVGNEVANETITGSTVSFGAVAKVNGISYATLAEAAAKAKEGYELILTGDITVDGANVSYLSGLTVDFNGYTLYLKGGYNCTNLSKDTTFKNGTIDISGAKATAADGLFTIGERDKSGVTVTLDNMKVTGDGYASAFGVFLVYGDNTIVVKNSEINLSNEQDEGTGSIFKNQNGAGSGGNFVITNTKITAKDVARVITSGTVSLDTVELTATGGEHGINGAYLTVKNSTLNISGGTGRALTLNTPNGDTECYVVIENSQLTFANNGEGDILYKTANNITIDESSSLTAPVVNASVADGATITSGGKTYALNTGYAVEKQANQDLVIKENNQVIEYVAKVTDSNGEVYYADIIVAAEKVVSGGTITLVENVAIGNTYTAVVFENAGNYKLDLNGHILSQKITDNGLSMALLVVRPNVELTVVDNVGGGKISATKVAVQLEGTLILESGTIANDVAPTPADVEASFSYSIWVISRPESNTAKFVMKGGSLVHGDAQDEFNFKDAVSVSYDYSVGNTNVEISGGKVEGDFYLESAKGTNTAKITGGSFTNDVSAYLAEDYGFIINSDGEYVAKTVSEIENHVARIGKIYYQSVADAIAVAMSGETVTLVADVANIGNVNLPAGVTFDGNNFTVSGNSSITMSATGESKVIKTNFKNISNGNNLSAIYLRPTDNAVKVISNNTFDKVDWDAIQVAPAQSVTETVKVEITENTFKSTAKRYIHVEGRGASIDLTIKDNKMLGTANTDGAVIDSIGVWYFATNSTVAIENNYVANLAQGGVNVALGGYNGEELKDVTVNFAQNFVDENNNKITNVAMVKGEWVAKLYTTFQAALNAANSGEEIVLLADLENAGSIKLPAGVTFDGNNFTVSGNSSITMSATGESKVINTNFKDISNGNNLSAIYLRPTDSAKKVIANNTFDTVEWDAIQVATADSVTATVNVKITGNTFNGTAKRYIHVEGYNETINLTIKDNKMFGSTNTDSAVIDAIGVWYFETDSNVEIDGNYVANIEQGGVNVVLGDWNTQTLKNVTSTFADNFVDEDGAKVSYVATVNSEDGELSKFYKTVADAVKAATNGETVSIGVAGTYVLPSFSNKNITIEGAVGDVVLSVQSQYGLHGVDVTFNDLTFNYYPNKNYTGLGHVVNAVYNNVTFEGQVFLYGQSEIFNNCTFNQNSSGAYNVWTYGADHVEFNSCTFNSKGKSVLVYNEGDGGTALQVVKSTFNASQTVDGKAAIEIDDSLLNKTGEEGERYDIVIDQATTATGFSENTTSGSSLYNHKFNGNGVQGIDTSVTIVDENGTVVSKPITYNHAAKIGTKTYRTLQDAINAVTEGNNEIVFLKDISENVTICQKAGVNITINGNGKTYNGKMKVDGNGRQAGTDTLTIKNVDFVTTTKDLIFIDANEKWVTDGSIYNYSHNVTVKDSTFTATGDALNTAVAMKIRQGKNIVIENVKTNGLHSVLQGYGIAGLTVEKLNIESGKGGISTGTSTGVKISNSNINVSGYGIRAGQKDSDYTADLTISNSTITAENPVVVRFVDSEDTYSVELKGNNTFTADNTQNSQITFTSGDDGEFIAPEGNVSLSGNGAANMSVYGMVARVGDEYFNDFFLALEAVATATDKTIVIFRPVVIEEDKTIDLTGITVKNSGEIVPMFRIQNNANVTVKGGNVTNSHYVFILGASDKSSAGNLTIESGKFHGATTVASVTKGTLTINGGEFSVDPYQGNYNYLINCIDESYRNGTAKVVINGGTFANFDPANNAAEGANTDFVPKEYATVEENGVYKVVDAKAYIGEVGYADFFDAYNDAQAGDTIVVRAPVVIEEDKTLNFTGITVVNSGDVYPLFRIQKGANVTVIGGYVTNSDYVFVLGASDKSSAGNLTIESGKFHGATTVASVTKGTLTIIGGEFSVDAYNGSYDFLINCIDESYRNGTAKVVINGGTFANFDPANNAAEGANTDFVPNVYATVEENGVYKIVDAKAYIGEVGYVTLQDAIDGAQNGDTIVMLDDVNEAVDVNFSTDYDLTIDLNGNTISSDTVTVFVSGGKLTVIDSVGGGMIETTLTNGDAVYVGGAEFVLESGTVKGENYGLTLVRGAKATMNGGTIISNTDKWAVYVQGQNDESNPTEFIMNSGFVKGSISGNGSENYSYTNITITGGKIEDIEVAIFHPQKGNLTITGGEIIGGDTGIEVRSGNVNISGGTITGNGANVSVTPSGSGTTVVGAALAISQHSTENDINVTITGGTFNGAMAVYEVDIQNNDSDNIAIDIQNGTFNGAVDSENVTEYVTAGEFAVALDASAIKQGSAMIVTANGATVGLADYIAEIAENNNYEAKAGVIYYATAEEAFEKALVGDTVVLLANATVDSTIVIDKKITIDLNGKTITATAGAFKLADGADVVVDNGTIIAANDAFDMDVSASAGTAKLDLASGLTVNAEWNAVYIGGNATLTVNGAKLTSSSNIYAVIQGNGSKHGTYITINAGSEIVGTDYAIYHPQKGTLIVNGGTITGSTGIEMRNGTLTVNGGEITATGAFSAGANGNGATVRGAAIVLSDHSTNGAPSAIINGGTFKGEYAIYETVDLGGNDTANSLSVLGGTFEGDVVTKTVDGYIQGIANFKGDVDVADLHADYGFDVWPDGTLHSNLISADLAEAHVGKYYYANLEDAIAAAQAGQTVTLHNNATLEETLVINKNIIIRSDAGATFTVNGTLSVEGSGVELIVYNDAIVTVKAEAKIGITDAVAYYSDIETAVATAVSGSTVVLLEDAEVDSIIAVRSDIVFDGNNKTITSSARKVFEIYANAEFNDLTVKATDNSQFGGRAFDTRENVTLTLNKVNVESVAINAQPITIGGSTNGTTVNISNSTINAGATGYAIISFVKSYIMVVDSTLNGYTAVYMKAGSEDSLVEIGSDSLNGGKLNVACTNNADSNAFGAIVSEANDVTFNVKNTEVVLGGLELAPMALVLYKAESNVANIDNVTVTGATEDYVIVGENNTTAISNSTIDAPVPFNALASTQAMFIDNNLKINVISATDAIANAKATISVGSTYALRAVANVGTYYFASLEAAVAFAKAGDAIVLAKDVTIDSAIEIDKAIAIDLNGKTITATAGAFKLADGANVVVYNGTIIAANDAFDMDVYASAGTAKLELLSDLTVKAGWNAVYIGGNATLTTEAKLYTTQAGCAVIQGNGNKAGTTIIVNGGEIVNDYDTAIYHPQAGTLTVNDGLIKGLTGIEMRNGTLVVNGGEVVATGAFSASANGNGTTVNGAAIAVSDHTTDGSANVTVNGGTFTGEYAIYETNEFGATANVMSVLDGTFYGKIYAYSVTDFIEGGLFSDNTFDEEYLVPNFMVAFDASAQDLYQVITMDAYKAEIIAAIESKVAGMTTVNYSKNGKAAIENYSTTAIDEVENATRVSAVKVIYNRVVEELASVYTAIQETVERGAITREINTYIIANGLKKADCLANADYVAAIEGLNGAYDAYTMNTYALAVFDAIDAVATAKAEELAQAKADAIAALETADAAYNGVNITTSMFTSINTSETVEEVEDALAIALVEISEIQKYKQAINDLGTAVAKNLEEINAIDQALIELETRLNTRFDGLDTAISNAKTVLDRVDTNVQTILGQQLTQNELDKLYEDLCDKIDTADDAILKYLEETVLVAVQQNGTAIGALTDKVIELDGLLNDKLDTTFATIIDDYLKVIDTNVDSILDAVKVGGTLDTQIKGAITTITSAISSSEAEILRVIREEIPVMISNQNTTIQGYINTLKDILEGRFDNVDSDLERIEGKIDTVDGIVDEIKAYLTTDGAGLDAKLDEMLTAVLEGQAKVVTDIAKILREEVIAAITTQTANVKTAINEAKDAIVGSASDPNTVLTLGNLFAKVEATIQQVQKSEGNITDMLHNTNESGLLDELNGKLDDIIADQSTLRGDIETIINTALTDMLTASDLTGIVNDLSSIKTTLGDANSGMVQKLETILTAVNNTTSAEEIAQKVKQELGDGSSLTAITGVLNTVKDTASSNNNLLNQIVSWMNDGGALKTMLDAIAGDAQKAATQAEAAYNEVAKLGLGTAQDLIAKLQKAVEDAEKAAKDAEGAVDGLTGAVNDVKTAAEAAELAAKAAEAAAKAAEAAAKKVQDATITAKAAAAIEDIESWISEYLDGLNAQTLKAVTYSTVTEEFRTELEGKLEKAYSEENRALILNYYDQAVASLKVASTEAEIDYAVKTFKANVALVDVLDTLTPIVPEKEDNSSIVAILVVIVVFVVVIAGAVVVGFVFILKLRKSVSNDTDPTDDEPTKKIEEKEETQTVEPVEEIEQVTEEAEQSASTETAEEVETATEEVVETAEEPAIEEVEEVEEVEETEDDNDDDDDNDDNDGAETEVVATEVVEENSEVDAFASLNKRSKTFEERMREADEQTKNNYEEIKDEFLSYKKVKSRVSKKCDSFRIGRKLLAKIIVRGKSLKCFLALDPNAYEITVFHHRDSSEKRAYAEVPMTMRVRSPRSVKNVKRLIGELANQNELIKKQG